MWGLLNSRWGYPRIAWVIRVTPLRQTNTTNDKVESELVELGLKSLETTAARLDTFEKSETDKSKLSVVTTEYYMLRIYLVSDHRPGVQFGILTTKLVMASRTARYRRAFVLQSQRHHRVSAAKEKYGGLLYYRVVGSLKRSTRNCDPLAGKSIGVKPAFWPG